MAEDLVRRVNTELDSISKGLDSHVLERFEKVKQWISMAERYGPGYPKVTELQRTIDQRIEDAMREFHVCVDDSKLIFLID